METPIGKRTIIGIDPCLADLPSTEISAVMKYLMAAVSSPDLRSPNPPLEVRETLADGSRTGGSMNAHS